jgi:RNA polymerase sigma factor (sigma-70 family)
MYLQTHLVSNKRPSDLADDDLVQRAHVGDQGAFEILVDRYNVSLFRLITHLVRDEDLAHDVLQHVFLQLYHSLPTLQAGGTLKAWLSQVARHRSIDELRRRRHLLFSEIEPIPDGGEYSFLATLPDPDRQPEEQVELRELQQQLLEAIEALPPHFRRVVLLRYATQSRGSSIEQALNIPAATAKTYFNRARKQLRTLLGPEFSYY